MGKTGFQSTRPHEARLDVIDLAAREHLVSIHAPARGATQVMLDRRERLPVSIHAPARGATEAMAAGVYRRGLFQSTRPHEARREQEALYVRPEQVSIHAPARGATHAGP